MFFLKDIYSHLRAGFRNETSFLLACILLGVLDCGSILGFIWYFFFKYSLPVPPSVMIPSALVYLLFAWMVAMLAARFSKLMSVQLAAMFYISVGIFFLLYGLMDIAGKMPPIWPWGILWVIIITVVLSNLGRELYRRTPDDTQY